ncbi:uncharacterized protein Triagg1_3399 [Trichoderma aggressivum f. europaeum]|uniref:Uncharacterized protein n=1 Tax=Trichoderma aggressivum f. europaeum TaxID=173218 RepID=A0AAE1M4S3_9HYPO|nr:hypothetical protein Triagg1_3399 [Trichoderma aggressivum f. europaeum]
MLSILPWALMALAPLAEARFGIRPRSADDDSLRCCPCIPTNLSPQDTTVTITATNSKETVTIDHTIVVPATTVFVTHTLAPSSPATVTQEVTVHPELPAKIETALVTLSSPEPSAQNEPIKTVTMTVQAGGDQTELPKTVTVTINPDETTFVSATATSAVTITVTQQTSDHSSAEPSHSSNSQEVGANTVTVANPQASQTEESKPSIKTVTVVQKPPAPSPSVETVTFVESPAGPSTMTVTLANNPSKAISASSTTETVTSVENPASSSTAAATSESNTASSFIETVTFVENPASPSTATVTLTSNSAATSASNPSNSTAETVTVVENPASPSTATVTLSSGSSKPTTSDTTTETVPFVENPPKPTATPLVVSPKSSSSLSIQTATSVAKPAKITAPPQAGTISPIVGQFTTMTQTVTSSGGDVNIEINIINIFTGEVVCRKQGSDEPCDPKPSPCLTTGIFTSTATAFNTVIVTVSPGMWTNGTSATGAAPPLGTGTGSPVLRRGRVPMIRKRL